MTAQGYGGAACDKKSSSSDSTGTTSAAYSVQIALLVILLLAAVVLTGFVGYLAYRITEFRKEQATSYSSNYASSRGDFMGSEMVGTGGRDF